MRFELTTSYTELDKDFGGYDSYTQEIIESYLVWLKEFENSEYENITEFLLAMTTATFDDDFTISYIPYRMKDSNLIHTCVYIDSTYIGLDFVCDGNSIFTETFVP